MKFSRALVIFMFLYEHHISRRIENRFASLWINSSISFKFNMYVHIYSIKINSIILNILIFIGK